MRTINLLFLTSALARLLLSETPPTIKTTAPKEITRLDECIQIRFLASNVFGLNRIAPRPVDLIQFTSHRMRVFTPENPDEQAVVDQLRQKPLEVAVYLVGRQTLEVPPAMAPRARLQGPASITLIAGSRLPDGDAIFSEGKTALAMIGQGSGYDVKKGEWMLSIRPLRASNQNCIQCHTTTGGTPKLGDALGVAMYVYRGGSPGSRQGL